MGPLEIGALGFGALFVLMVLQVPIGFAMIIVGVVGFALQAGWGPAVTLLVNEPTGVLSSADLATVPLFLLMGTFASVAGFSTDIYNAAAACLGHRRGGLAYATIGGSAAFGVVCGSSTATAAVFARAALPEMLKRGYSPAFSTGTIAAGGTLKSLIPPSIVMILYCIVSKAFILDLFRAAIIPAFVAIAVNLLAIALIVRFRSEVCAGRRADADERALGGDQGRRPGHPADGCGVRRPLQRHLHRDGSRFGRRRAVAAVRAGARPAQLGDPVSGLARIRSRHRHDLRHDHGRVDIHVFSQSWPRAGSLRRLDLASRHAAAGDRRGVAGRLSDPGRGVR